MERKAVELELEKDCGGGRRIRMSRSNQPNSSIKSTSFVISTEGRNFLIQRTTVIQEVSPFGRNDVKK